MKIHDNCEGCDGSGIRSPATPTCALVELLGGTIVERCDMCEKYETDLEAAASLYKDVRWVMCQDGGEHAVGRTLLIPRINKLWKQKGL